VSERDKGQTYAINKGFRRASGEIIGWQNSDDTYAPGAMSAAARRLLTSPAYHLLRSWHDLPPLPYLGQQLAYIRDDPNLQYV